MLHTDPVRSRLGPTLPPPHGSGLGMSDRVFFAIQPPASAAPNIAKVAREMRAKHGLNGKAVRPRCFHISLLFVGFYGRLSPDALAVFIKAAATVAMPRFRIALNRAMSFRHAQQRPLVLSGDDGVTGAVWLRDRLLAATMDIPGFSPDGRNFTPHLTLLRDKQGIGEEPIEELAWTVSEFVLIRSIYGEGRHALLGRWALHG